MAKKQHSSKVDVAFLKRINEMLDGILNDEIFVAHCLDALAQEVEVEWEKCYEYPPQQLRKVLIKCFQASWLREDVTQEKLLDFVDADLTLEQWDTMRDPGITRAGALGVLLASAYDLECLGRYGVHMHDLVKSASNGNRKAIMRALEIDPASANCKPIRRELKRARTSKDAGFIEEFSRRLEWRISKHQLHRKKVRLILEVLEEQNIAMPLVELHNLLVQAGTLRAADGPDNLKTLMANRLKDKKELKK